MWERQRKVNSLTKSEQLLSLFLFPKVHHLQYCSSTAADRGKNQEMG